MPLYSFKCTKCDHEFDEFYKIQDRNDSLNLPCHNCKEEGSVIRLYSTNGFVDPGILNADKNMEKSGVLKELNRLKQYHPYMRWTG